MLILLLGFPIQGLQQVLSGGFWPQAVLSRLRNLPGCVAAWTLFRSRMLMNAWWRNPLGLPDSGATNA
jgi:hypothetical protein